MNKVLGNTIATDENLEELLKTPKNGKLSNEDLTGVSGGLPDGSGLMSRNSEVFKNNRLNLEKYELN